ncbi:hypothetical protein FQN60_011120 [Etheostoma spectabile]|uniref:Uncharacterized protein n=1 Tax=Etheostoma spectabile TaxID=54343 RepID=A0A5J5DR67_9PERO|nr:hypothetical protein FQN60_011120 [Etheostoma spectabile]
MYKPKKDDIYAYALSKTLTKVSSPATVGLYSSCQNRINMILGQMEVYMKREALRIEQEYEGRYRPRSVTPSFSGFLALIGRMLFYRPIWTEENQQHHNIRFIYVHFSAWHFAGSDLLWAGLAIRLFQAMQMNFGKLPIVLYRTVENGPNQWRSKKVCCCPLWFLVLSILVVPVIILIFVLTVGLPKPEVKPGGAVNATISQVDVLDGLVIAAFGVPTASALRFVFLIGKNLIFNQDKNIKKGMDNERVSSHLGFMNEVRKEMWFLSRFIQFMEVFERRRIRVVLQITNLDRCSPKKIVTVLDAINILLSDEECPYISILAVNPDVLVEKVNFADGCFSKEDRAYALLNRIVTLAFTVPPLCDDSKRSLFHSLTSNSKNPEDISMSKNRRRTGGLEKTSSSDLFTMEIAFETKESYPLIDKTAADLKENEEEVEMLVQSTLTSNERNLNKYMFEDAMSMRRAINSIWVTVIIMKTLKKELPQPEYIAAWVVLANQWPCRLSWILQCVEDAQQRADIDRNNSTNTDDSKTLWTVFNESRAELYVMSAQIEDLLEQDGDPEMFERFLTVDFQFTVKDLKTFEEVTLERMEYPRKYIDTVKSHNLNGAALVFGDANDLKNLLDMTFGEWATFRLHFLGLPSHLRPQYKNMALTHSHPQNKMSAVPFHVSNQYLSNPSLINS